MRDPKPENISGEKRHSFSWEIEVDVGQLLLGLAVLFVAWKLAPLFTSQNDKDEADTRR